MGKQILLKPLTMETWDDFEKLFGTHGAYGGCWCMWWRITRKQLTKNGNIGNRMAMQEIVKSAKVPGLVAYLEGEVCGWVSVAPREDFASLNRSPVLRQVDEKPVWSIVCLFVGKAFRGQNFSLQLVKGAVDYAKSNGAEIVEAYPTITASKKLEPVSIYMGLKTIFQKVGFVQVKKASKSKLIMRYYFRR